MEQRMERLLPIWPRLGITFVAMLVASYLAGLLWVSITGWEMPSYVAGIVGGLTTLPVWELLKRFRPK